MLENVRNRYLDNFCLPICYRSSKASTSMVHFHMSWLIIDQRSTTTASSKIILIDVDPSIAKARLCPIHPRLLWDCFEDVHPLHLDPQIRNSESSSWSSWPPFVQELWIRMEFPVSKFYLYFDHREFDRFHMVWQLIKLFSNRAIYSGRVGISASHFFNMLSFGNSVQ